MNNQDNTAPINDANPEPVDEPTTGDTGPATSQNELARSLSRLADQRSKRPAQAARPPLREVQAPQQPADETQSPAAEPAQVPQQDALQENTPPPKKRKRPLTKKEAKALARKRLKARKMQQKQARKSEGGGLLANLIGKVTPGSDSEDMPADTPDVSPQQQQAAQSQQATPPQEPAEESIPQEIVPGAADALAQPPLPATASTPTQPPAPTVTSHEPETEDSDSDVQTAMSAALVSAWPFVEGEQESVGNHQEVLAQAEAEKAAEAAQQQALQNTQEPAAPQTPAGPAQITMPEEFRPDASQEEAPVPVLEQLPTPPASASEPASAPEPAAQPQPEPEPTQKQEPASEGADIVPSTPANRATAVPSAYGDPTPTQTFTMYGTAKLPTGWVPNANRPEIIPPKEANIPQLRLSEPGQPAPAQDSQPPAADPTTPAPAQSAQDAAVTSAGIGIATSQKARSGMAAVKPRRAPSTRPAPKPAARRTAAKPSVATTPRTPAPAARTSTPAKAQDPQPVKAVPTTASDTEERIAAARERLQARHRRLRNQFDS